ncbi:MAG: hypothetical protein ACRDNG_14895 [Gaiellaceae bacterium]
MFDRLLARFRKRRQPRSHQELAEEEAIRREAEEEWRRAEAKMAEQRGEIERHGGGASGGWGGR